MQRPGAGGAGTQRPALPPSRPGQGDFAGLRPGQGGSGTLRPGDNRPNGGVRPDGRPNRPINTGDRNVNINNRPTWANIDNNRLNNVNQNWGNAIGDRNNLNNWQDRRPDRVDHWDNWGDNVRGNWNGNHNNYFNDDWWGNHHHDHCGWDYCNGYYNQGSGYWWGAATYAGLNDWFSWSAPAEVWQEPIYYDYGTGGNVVYEGDEVYVNQQPVATTVEYAQSAAALATVPPPASEAEAEAVEWMPLGTFAFSSSDQETEPTRLLQLAVSKEGIVSGTYYNTATDKSQTVQGAVDKDTQRVAFRIGYSQDIVIETGLYNLTQSEAPTLVHFGDKKSENYLLVRLEE